MKKKILIVDDETEILNLLKMRLESNSYEVMLAADGKEGLEQLKSQTPDLVLLDVLMPNMDGLAFVQAMNKMDALKDIPVIVLTAKDNMETGFEKEGVQDYILKPYDDEELLALIKKRLS